MKNLFYIGIVILCGYLNGCTIRPNIEQVDVTMCIETSRTGLIILVECDAGSEMQLTNQVNEDGGT